MIKIFSSNTTVIFIVLLLLVKTQALAQFSGGEGSNANPYKISSVADLAQLATLVNSGNNYSGIYFTVTNDIDLNINPYNIGAGWEPIGNSSTSSFQGNFNGAGKTISNLFINRNTQNYVGLFGNVANANISDLKITISDQGVTGYNNVGGLAGYCSFNGGNTYNITNCSVSAPNGNITGPSNVGGLIGSIGFSNSSTVNISNCYTNIPVNGGTVGGLIGCNQSPYSDGGTSIINIKQCITEGFVTGRNYIGGLIGQNNLSASGYFVNIEKCGTKGNISGAAVGDWDNVIIGGFIGQNNPAVSGSSIDITNCYANGNVAVNKGSPYAGGFVGRCHGLQNITNCYTSGQVTVSRMASPVGGFIGARNGSGIISNCYFNNEDNTKGIGTGAVPVTGKNKTDLKFQSTFTGWDFSSIWEINEGQSYPYFKFENNSEPSFIANDTAICYTDKINLNHLVYNKENISTLEFSTSVGVVSDTSNFITRIGDTTIYIKAASSNGSLKSDTMVLTMYDSLYTSLTIVATSTAQNSNNYMECDNARGATNIFKLVVNPSGGCFETTGYIVKLSVPKAISVSGDDITRIATQTANDTVIVICPESNENDYEKEIKIGVFPASILHKINVINIETITTSDCTSCKREFE